MSAKGVPLIEARCGKPMKRGGACGMTPGHCGRCRSPEAVRKAYDRNMERHRRLVAERHAWLDQLKLDKGCVDCGYDKAAVALDFDHRDPELKISGVAAMLWSSTALIQAEIDKCDIRCSNCHRVKTHTLEESRNRQYERRRPAASETDDGPVA
jgi:hypothetical protein